MHSKLTSSRWNRCSILAIGRGTKKIMFHLSIGRGRRNSKSNTCLFGVCIRCMRMRNLSFSCLSILTLIPFPSACFFVWDENIGCRLGCFTLTVCTMMNPPNTSLLISFSLTLLMGLLTSSLPWQSSTNMLFNLPLFPTLS